MPFILREENSTDNPPLATVYGKQITAGKMAYYISEGGRTKCIIFLGDGEMDGIERFYYNGDLIPEYNGTDRNWKFHPGANTSQIVPIDVTNILDAETLTLATNPYNIATVATETLTAGGGTRKLSFNGESTGNIAYSASNATIQTALEGLSTIGSGNVTVTGTNPYTVTFNPTLASVASTFTVDGTLLTGGTSTITNNSEVALVAGVDPTPTAPETSIYPTGVGQHQKLYVVYSSGNNIKLSLTPGGTAITGWFTSGDENTYLETNLKVYKADAGYFDSVQGRPEFFPTIDFTFSGIAYVEVNLDSEHSAIEDEPTKFKIFVRGKKLQNYDDTGTPIGVPTFSANNALVAVDIMLNYMKLTTNRISSTSFVRFRDHCAEIITWSSGDAPVESSPTWTFTNSYTSEPFLGTLTNSNTDTDKTNWETGAKTVQVFDTALPLNKFKATYNGGHSAMGLSTASSPTTWTDIKYGWHPSTITNVCYVVVNGVIQSGVTYPELNYGDRLEVQATPTSVTWYHNDTVVYSTTPSYGGTLVGAVAFADFGAKYSDLKIYPVSNVSRPIERFDAHVVYPSEVASSAALEQVMGRAPDCHWQDVNGKITFITGSGYVDLIASETPSEGERVLVSYLAYDPNQSLIKCNVVEDSFATYKKPVEEKQNFLRIEFRDVEDEYFTKKYTFRDRPDLRDYIGYLVDFGIMQIGVASQSLSERMSEAALRWNTDLDLFVSVKGSPSTFSLAKGDLVKFAHDVPDWSIAEAPLFIVIEETFENEDTADERSFILQIYDPAYYSDTDHGPIVPSLPPITNSQLVPPAVMPDVTLTESYAVMPDGSYVASILGDLEYPEYYDVHSDIYLKELQNLLGSCTYNLGTNTFTMDSAYTVPSTSTPIQLVSSALDLPDGATYDQPYYTTAISGQNFKLSLAPSGGTAVVFTGAGTGLKVYEYTAWRLAQQGLLPDDNFLGNFEIFPAKKAFTLVRAVSLSRANVSLPFAQHTTKAIEVLGASVPPSAPTNARFAYDGATLRFEWDSVLENTARYKVTDEFNRLVTETTNTFYLETNVDTMITRRIYAVSPTGTPSSTYATTTFVLPPRLDWVDAHYLTINADKTLTVSSTGGGNKYASMKTAAILGNVRTRLIVSPHSNSVSQGICFTYNVDNVLYLYDIYFNADGTCGRSGSSAYGSYSAGDEFILESNPTLGIVRTLKRTYVNGEAVETQIHSGGATYQSGLVYIKAYSTSTSLSTVIDLNPILIGELTEDSSSIPTTAQNIIGSTTYNATTGSIASASGTGWGSSGLSLLKIPANKQGEFRFSAFGGFGVNGQGTVVGLSSSASSADIANMPFCLTINGSGHVLYYSFGSLIATDTTPSGFGGLLFGDMIRIGRRNGKIYVYVKEIDSLANSYGTDFTHASLDTEELWLDTAFNHSIGSFWTVNDIKLITPYTTLLTPDGDIPSIAVGLKDNLVVGKNSAYSIPKFNISSPTTGQLLSFNSSEEVVNTTLSVPVGTSITGGGANRVLFENGSSVLSTDANFLFNGTNLILGATSSTGGKLQIRATTEQLRIEYDASNYFKTTVASDGTTTLDSVGSGSKFVFNDNVGIGVSPLAKLHVQDTAQQLRLSYDASNYIGFTANSVGQIEILAVGTNPGFEFAGGAVQLRRRFRTRTDTTLATQTLETTKDLWAITTQDQPLFVANHASSTPYDGEQVRLRVKDDGTSRAITWDTNYVAGAGVSLPLITVPSKHMEMLFEWYDDISKYVLMAVGLEDYVYTPPDYELSYVVEGLPTLVSSQLFGYEDFKIVGNTLYGTNNKFVETVQINSPTDLTLIGRVGVADDGMSISVLGDRAYVGEMSHCEVVTIKDPFAPTIIYADGHSVTQVEAVGSFVYSTSTTDQCIRIYNTQDDNLSLVGSISTGTNEGRFAIDKDFLYVLNNTDYFLELWDISNPYSITSTAHPSYSTASVASDIVVVDNKAYILTDRLEIFDVSDKTGASLISATVLINFSFTRLLVIGKYAYILSTSGTMEVVDISDASSPLSLGEVTLPYNGTCLVAVGSYLYVGTTSTIEVYNLLGVRLPSASIGSLVSDKLHVRNELIVANQLHVHGGLNVGINGIQTLGNSVSKQFIATDGSASDPTYTFCNSLGTGFYSSSPNILNVGVHGAAVWEFSSTDFYPLSASGNIGTSGARLLSVYSVGLDIYSSTGVNTASIIASGLGNAKAFDISVTSTAASGSGHVGLGVSLSGANASSGITTYGAQISNIHSGTTSANVGLYLNSSGASKNFALITNGGFVGINTSNPNTRLHVIDTVEQVRIGYDTLNYYSTTVSSAGLVTFDAIGASAEFLFSDGIRTSGVIKAGSTPTTLTDSAGKILSASLNTVGIGQGGTGQTTATNAYIALSPITTRGDLVIGNVSGQPTRFAGNPSTQRLLLWGIGNGVSSLDPSWDSILISDLPTITAVKGGTGQTVYAVGDILYASTTTALSKLADIATGNALISGGVGVAPSWGKVALTTHVSGILPIANGGTNASTASITSFNNITGYTASGATGTTSTNLVFSTSPVLTTPNIGSATASLVTIASNSQGLVLGSTGQLAVYGNCADAFTDIFQVDSAKSYAAYKITAGSNTSALRFLISSGSQGFFQAGEYAPSGQNGSLIFSGMNAYDANDVQFNTATAWCKGSFGVGMTSTPTAQLHVIKTTEQFRVGYDASNYYKTTVGSTGIATFDAVGSGSSFVYLDKVTVQQQTVGNEVFRIESIATNDDPAEQVYQNRVTTTNATPTTIHSLTIAGSNAYMATGTVVARRTGGSAGTADDMAAYDVLVCYKDNGLGGADIIGSTVNAVGESQAAWNVTFDGTTGMVMKVTGATNNNITWHTTLRVYQVGT